MSNSDTALIILGCLFLFGAVFIGIPLIFWWISTTIHPENTLFMKNSRERLGNNWGIPIAITAIPIGISILFSIGEQIFGVIAQIGGAVIGGVSGELGDAVLIVFTFVAVVLVFGISILIAILKWGINSALILGTSQFYIKFIRKIEVKLEQIFEPFKKRSTFMKALATYILTAIFTFLWGLLLVIPGIIASYSYALAYLIIVDEPEISAIEAIRKSKKMMYGYKAQRFWLDCRFIGWHFAAVFSFFIGYLWLTPYMLTSYANFYDKVRREYESKDSVNAIKNNL